MHFWNTVTQVLCGRSVLQKSEKLRGPKLNYFYPFYYSCLSQVIKTKLSTDLGRSHFSQVMAVCQAPPVIYLRPEKQMLQPGLFANMETSE